MTGRRYTRNARDAWENLAHATEPYTHFLCCDELHSVHAYRSHMSSEHGGRSETVLHVRQGDVNRIIDGTLELIDLFSTRRPGYQP